MASNVIDSVVKLKEKDVPGATFMYSAIEKHSVLRLRRWLECRGIKRSGTKSLLLERYVCYCFACRRQLPQISPCACGQLDF